jgi:hypothetical protein
MLMKNPYRITEKISLTEFIHTTGGPVLGAEWCDREAGRLRCAGITAKSVRRGNLCYVVRNIEGCRISKQDEDLVDSGITPDATPVSA